MVSTASRIEAAKSITMRRNVVDEKRSTKYGRRWSPARRFLRRRPAGENAAQRLVGVVRRSEGERRSSEESEQHDNSVSGMGGMEIKV